MKNHKKSVPIIAALLAVLLVACGPSDEKLSEAEEARNILVQAKQTAEDTYLDVSDTSQRSILDELAVKEAEIEQIDFKKLNDKKIDEILPGIAGLTESYQNVGKELSGVLTDETKATVQKINSTIYPRNALPGGTIEVKVGPNSGLSFFPGLVRLLDGEGNPHDIPLTMVNDTEFTFEMPDAPCQYREQRRDS